MFTEIKKFINKKLPYFIFQSKCAMTSMPYKICVTSCYYLNQWRTFHHDDIHSRLWINSTWLSKFASRLPMKPGLNNQETDAPNILFQSNTRQIIRKTEVLLWHEIYTRTRLLSFPFLFQLITLMIYLSLICIFQPFP